MASQPETIGSMLYEIVQAYADLGIHRTGTTVDAATTDWFAAHLQARGAKVVRQDYDFSFFEATAKVTVAGSEISSMPLYYEAVGNVKTNNVAVAEFGDGEHGSGLDDSLEAIINKALSEGYESLVIATHGGNGRLVAINCQPNLRNRLPVMLVPGRYANALKTKLVSVEYTASIKPKTSTNIIGHWGTDLGEPPFVITTPVSGWFTCAGERGTGIAVALYLAEWLAKHRPHIPLMVVAPSGHELGFYGAYRMAETVTMPPRAVLHLGSCIAAHDGQMQGVVHASTSACHAVSNALAPIHIEPKQPENHVDPDCWVGESQCWARFGMPMLSVAGISPLFHTPDDVAAQATTPALLQTAAEHLLKATLALLQDDGSI